MYYLLCDLGDGTMGFNEPTEEVLKIIVEDARKWENAERREREHVEFHIDGMKYEGLDMANLETPEDIIIRKETASQINSTSVIDP